MTTLPRPPRDCGFDDDGLWFRYRAAAIILHEGRVLMARNEADPYRYSIGGGVHHGETAVDAVRREVWEETGVWMDVDRLAFVHENFFRDTVTPARAGRLCHEVTFYFLMANDPTVPPRTGGSETTTGAREWFEWVDLDAYGRDGIVSYPSFFATELAEIGTEPVWITTRD